MIKNRWNTEDFVFDDPRPRPQGKTASSWGLFVRLLFLIPLGLVIFFIFCVGLANVFMYLQQH